MPFIFLIMAIFNQITNIANCYKLALIVSKAPPNY
jgi:hypothetical protein